MNHIDCVMKRDVYPQKMDACSKNIRGISFFVLKISVVISRNNICCDRCCCMGILPLVER